MGVRRMEGEPLSFGQGVQEKLLPVIIFVVRACIEKHPLIPRFVENNAG